MTPSSFTRRYLVPYLPWFAAGTLALFATNWLAVTIPLHVATAIDALERAADPGPVVARQAGIIALMGLGIIVVRSLSRVMFFTPGRLVEARLKRDLFARLLRQQPAFLSRFPVGDLVARASSDVGGLRLLVGFGTLQIINTVLAVSLAGVQMVRISPRLALLTLVPVAIGLAITQITIRWLYVLLHRMQAQLATLSDHILSSYQGVATIQDYAAEDAFHQRFDQANRAYHATAIKRANLRTVIAPILALAAAINVFLLLWLGGPMAVDGEISVGELVAFVTLVAMLVAPLRAMSFLLSIWKQAQVSLERLGEVVAPEPERPDLPDPRPAPAAPPEIRVEGLSFAYPDDPEKPVLREVSLRAPPGATVGVLGPTGAGKTTLLRCLARLYNPPPATVLVDGIDLREVDLDDWRRSMTFVPQRPILFSEPLRDNVLLGGPDDGRLERALALTALDVDVQALPQGAESPVGETGIMLSGGQRQRVALARGLLRQHRVLLLDDVLSAVDHATEHQLIEAIRSLRPRPTTLVVAHRISALQHADLVLVMQGGRVVDQGTHEELLTRPGLYRDTWERQREGEGT